MSTEEILDQRTLSRIKRIEMVIEKEKRKRQAKIERTDWLSKLNKEASSLYYKSVLEY